MTATKLKVSLTLSAEVLALVDRDARRKNATRSGVVEGWLRRAAASNAQQEIDAATAAYYASLDTGDREEDEQMSRASSAAAKRVAYDETPSRRRARR